MSFTTPAKRRRALLLASSMLALSGSHAIAQTPATTLPPVEVTSPTDPNRTRAKPAYDEASTSRRIAPTAAPSTGARPAAGTGSDAASQSAAQGAGGSSGERFSGIVGASSTVITADTIAHSPAQTLPEILAQVQIGRAHV